MLDLLINTLCLLGLIVSIFLIVFAIIFGGFLIVQLIFKFVEICKEDKNKPHN